jgi:hypothetical protein
MHCSSITKTNRLITFRSLFTVYCDTHTHTHTQSVGRMQCFTLLKQVAYMITTVSYDKLVRQRSWGTLWHYSKVLLKGVKDKWITKLVRSASLMTTLECWQNAVWGNITFNSVKKATHYFDERWPEVHNEDPSSLYTLPFRRTLLRMLTWEMHIDLQRKTRRSKRSRGWWYHNVKTCMKAVCGSCRPDSSR